MRETAPLAPVLTAGVFLGVGLGGSFDGIVFHQLLQWHHMLTSHSDYPMNTVPGLGRALPHRHVAFDGRGPGAALAGGAYL